MPELIIRSGKHQGKKLVFREAEVTFGRDEDCQIRLASTDVSRKHCVFRPTPEGLTVRDLGSRNGTLVNDVAIDSERLLAPGDMVRIGPMLLEVPGHKPPRPAGEEAPAQEPPSGHIATPDEIAGWLTDEDAESLATDSTTIIRAAPAAPEPSEPAVKQEPVTDHAAPKTDPERKKFKSVAEEGADIIRRWKELVAQEGE